MSSSRSSEGDITVKIISLVIMLIFAIWFYSASESGTGWIASKWSETRTSCSDGDCTTTITYYIQLKDSRVYTVFWGTAHWDPMMENSEIAFEARGRRINFFMWRMAVPAIFSWQQLTAAP